jgi:hypothetical protein
MRLEATGDADGFEIVLPEAGRRLLISLDSGFECRVVVGSGSFEKSFVTQNGRLLLDGIYTDTRSVPVRVFASGSSGEYRLSVAVDEFSGDFASAKSINPGPIGDVYSGGIQLPGDIDNLAVQILQTGKVIARLDPVGEVFDVSVDIVDGSGAVIGTSLVNPDYSVTVSASVSFGDSIFVRVRGNNGSAGRYKLFVQQVPDDFEDTIANASVFAGSVSGNLDFQSDKDVFEFVVNSSGSYVFHTRPDIGSKAEPSLNVIRRGQIVSSVDANVPNSSGLVTVDLVAGEHVFVEVAGFGR